MDFRVNFACEGRGVAGLFFAGPPAPAGDLLCHCSVKGTVQIEQSSVATVDAFVD